MMNMDGSTIANTKITIHLEEIAQILRHKYCMKAENLEKPEYGITTGMEVRHG